MGRSYWFECGKCGYRAKVSGGADRGLDFFVQTVLCQDCKELYDAVVRIRFPVTSQAQPQNQASGPRRPRLLNPLRPPQAPPAFLAALNRLPLTEVRRFRWLRFPPQCPMFRWHRVRSWREPDQCPKCGLYLEKNALPYRIWE